MFPGEPLTIQQFHEWIDNRESAKTISLQEAKKEWANKREKLLSTDK